MGSRTPAEEANLNGFHMYYEVHGHGEPVVFIHGFSLDSRMWKQQRALQSKYRVIVADMRLHGRSRAPENAAYGLAEAAADVRGLLDHLGIDRAHVAGLSMGGMFVLETALRYPERVRQLDIGGCGN
jgi:3-oxoadipate enol-lactonase